MQKEIRKIVYSSLWIAFGVILPQVFHLMGLGTILSPMHIPIFLCGAFMGWKYGLIAGLITPLLSSLLTSMPPFPVGLFMAAELATYGALIGIGYSMFRKSSYRLIHIDIALIFAMISGRLVYALIRSMVTGIRIWVAVYDIFINAWPAVLLQLFLIPTVILLGEKVKLQN